LTLNTLLGKLPLASTVFLAYAVVGCIMLIGGTLEYGQYSDNLLAIGLACGAIGIPRALSKSAVGVRSVNLLGFIESIPIPTVAFLIFLLASSVSLATGAIEFGAFSDNVMKVGIACGAIQAARSLEIVSRNGLSSRR
jgi:hypothetical protein